jgi:hypothetical protein
MQNPIGILSVLLQHLTSLPEKGGQQDITSHPLISASTNVREEKSTGNTFPSGNPNGSTVFSKGLIIHSKTRQTSLRSI